MSWNDNWNKNEYGRSTWGSQPVSNKRFKDDSDSENEEPQQEKKNLGKQESKQAPKETKTKKDESSDEELEERELWEKTEKEETKGVSNVSPSGNVKKEQDDGDEEEEQEQQEQKQQEQKQQEEEEEEEEEEEQEQTKTKTTDKPSIKTSDDINKDQIESEMQKLSLHGNSQTTNGDQAGNSTVNTNAEEEKSKSGDKQKKRRKKKKKSQTVSEGQKKCFACHKQFDEKAGQVKNLQFYCTPCASKTKCHQCSRWLDPSLGKADDQEGVWYCFRCWNKWEKTQQKYWSQQDPEQYLSAKMKKMDKEWSKGGGW